MKNMILFILIIACNQSSFATTRKSFTIVNESNQSIFVSFDDNMNVDVPWEPRKYGFAIQIDSSHHKVFDLGIDAPGAFTIHITDDKPELDIALGEHLVCLVSVQIDSVEAPLLSHHYIYDGTSALHCVISSQDHSLQIR